MFWLKKSASNLEKGKLSPHLCFKKRESHEMTNVWECKKKNKCQAKTSETIRFGLLFPNIPRGKYRWRNSYVSIDHGPLLLGHLSGVAEWLAIDFHHTVGLTSDMFSYVTKFRSLNTLTKKEFPTTTKPKPPWFLFFLLEEILVDHTIYVFDVWKCSKYACQVGVGYWFLAKKTSVLDLTKKVPDPTVDGSEILQATVEAGSVSYYLQGLIHPRRGRSS